MAGPGKEYVIGKGKLYFDAFAPGSKIGTGERYLGNSPELTQSRSSDTLDHMDADEGLNVKDEQITISNDITGGFALDSIETANVAMWFGGTVDRAVMVAASAIVEPDFIAQRGRSYQLGKTEDHPSGTRSITNVLISTVAPGALPADPLVVTPLPLGSYDGNVEIDLARGRLYVESDAPDIDDNAVLRVTYDQEGVKREVIIEKGQEIRGALRFLSTNPVGAKRDYYWPYVKITANGDYALKGDGWQQMSFTYEVLKLDGSTERVYIDSVPA